jgi:hypothetical protein
MISFIYQLFWRVYNFHFCLFNLAEKKITETKSILIKIIILHYNNNIFFFSKIFFICRIKTHYFNIFLIICYYNI